MSQFGCVSSPRAPRPCLAPSIPGGSASRRLSSHSSYTHTRTILFCSYCLLIINCRTGQCSYKSVCPWFVVVDLLMLFVMPISE